MPPKNSGALDASACGRSFAGLALDRRRFRSNIVIESDSSEPFHEDEWVGKTLVFGDADSGPAVSVTQRDLRCMMLNLDPDTGRQDARVMKAVVRMNGNYAGVYATVVRAGTLRAGATVHLDQAAGTSTNVGSRS